ncbi:hypothetical protein GCK72_004605 [Caenorhabditis remanei]|uniref:Tyr recombinase domain-containing protein n=1 Tax=Caenorhabditis remanei TaxID=31234 RepID=A0A6A5HCV3_CAERE|nr:hypothetical protein GCK72_004605 [Caenorhabditis remanei]KAF1764656.1 hypothetical protein GCK72_004605 [Caenorhabditis remanei]
MVNSLGPGNLVKAIEFLARAALEGKAPSTARDYLKENAARRKWIQNNGLPLNETSTLIYLASRSELVGGGSLAKIVAAFQMTNTEMSKVGRQLAADVIRATRRKEVQTRQQPKAVPWTEEAAKLKRSDLTQTNGILEIRVRKAKNDQQALGRSTFIPCPDGSDLDCRLKRWKVCESLRSRKSEYLFSNLNNGAGLSASSISSIVKKKLMEFGIDGTHHSLRRGAANDLQRQGFSKEEIKAGGRWRSDAGLKRYLVDTPEAQGISAGAEEKEDGPPVLVRQPEEG